MGMHEDLQLGLHEASYGASPKNDRIRTSSTASYSMLWPCC